jgi:hypothetical protein
MLFCDCESEALATPWYDPVTMPTAAETRFIAFCILMLILVHSAVLYMQWSNVQAAKPDFAALYSAGKLAVSDGDSRTWHWVSRDSVDRSVVDMNGVTVAADRLHPPFEMLIFAPLAFLKYQAAYLAWFACNLVMLFSVPILLWNYLPNLHHWFAYVMLLVGTFFPVFVTVVQGQDSILLLFLLAYCFSCLKSRRELLAGVALALAMFKFMLVIPIVVALAIMRKRRVLAGFALGFLALLSVTVLVFGNHAIVRYVRFMIQRQSGGQVETAGSESMMPNFRGFVHTLAAGTVSVSWLNSIVVVGSVLTFVLIAIRWAREPDEPSSLDLLFSAQVVIATIVSYHLFVHDASILLLPILLALNRLAGPTCRKGSGLLFALATGIMYVVPHVTALRVSMPIVFGASVLLLGGLCVSLSDHPEPARSTISADC